jgi:L-alanine-DL-glutamate epimerase-like enolase superfamily enzyme
MMDSQQWSRRRFFQGGSMLLAGSLLASSNSAFAQAVSMVARRPTIARVQTMVVGGESTRTFTLVKVTASDGQYGIAEAYGTPGAGIVEQIKALEPEVVGKDPLEIDRIFTLLGEVGPGTSRRTDGSAHMLLRAASGIEMAIWDLAGKIVNLPLSIMLGGRFRDRVRLYDHARPRNMFDLGSVREWADQIRANPSGFTAHKINIQRTYPVWETSNDVQSAPDPNKDMGNRFMTSMEIRRIAEGFENMRDAIGWDHDLMVHCHWELDLPSALRLADALAPVKPLWLEDPLPVHYSDGWKQLVLKSPVPIHTGENLGLTEEFLPFIANQATHYVNPDLRNSGGFLETKRTADVASLYGIPTTTHNTGSFLHTYQVCQWAASIRDFVMCETSGLEQGDRDWRDEMLDIDGRVIENGTIKVSDKPGGGVDLNREVVEAHLAPGERWWG